MPARAPHLGPTERHSARPTRTGPERGSTPHTAWARRKSNSTAMAMETGARPLVVRTQSRAAWASPSGVPNIRPRPRPGRQQVARPAPARDEQKGHQRRTGGRPDPSCPGLPRADPRAELSAGEPADQSLAQTWSWSMPSTCPDWRPQAQERRQRSCDSSGADEARATRARRSRCPPLPGLEAGSGRSTRPARPPAGRPTADGKQVPRSSVRSAISETPTSIACCGG